MVQKDNASISEKVTLRRTMLQQLAGAPVILETHGGLGEIFKKCYRQVGRGAVFEKNADRAEVLALQRPTWAVYETECEAALAAGAGAHLEANVVDVDPYGDPWPAIGAFFESDRPRPAQLAVVVHDGSRQSAKRQMHVIRSGAQDEMIGWYGAGLFKHYLEACRRMITKKAARAGYGLDRFAGFHSGRAKCDTHYLAMFTR